MIKTETYQYYGKTYIFTYSDEHRYVVRDGIAYEEAVDPAEFGRTYTEGDLIEETEAEAEEILKILTGESE